ncbi:MAG: helix-turn-helix domain-containing protein [Caulobacteraceae bacterium]
MNEKVLDLQGIGIRIRTEREKIGLTREQFAEAVDLSALYIGQVERGQRTMSLNTFVRILECLHVEPGAIIFGKTRGAKG